LSPIVSEALCFHRQNQTLIEALPATLWTNSVAEMSPQGTICPSDYLC
jgi:hypothetical protein